MLFAKLFKSLKEIMEIKKLFKKDIKQCMNIYNYYIENTTATFEEKRLTFFKFYKRIKKIAKNYPFFVAVENNKVLGYAYLNSFNERSAYKYTVDLSIYLDKNCLNKKIGTKLYNIIEETAIKLGYKNIISLITEENENSKIFHEKMGFSCVGKLEGVGIKFGKKLSVSYYQKIL